jgi:hypothetical protein
MGSAGLASACIAGTLNKDCLLEYEMKINYPVINYKFVTEKENLGDAIAGLTDRPFTTCILQKGHYSIKCGYSVPIDTNLTTSCYEINIFKMNGDICFAIKVKYIIIHRKGSNV